MASKQMSYCSLEEAWGTEYANLYKKDDDMLTKMPKIDNDVDTNILNDRSITKVSTSANKNSISDLDEEMSQYYMDIKGEIDTKKDGQLTTTTSCENFLEHVLECEDCKNKVNRLLNNDKSSNNSIIEKFNVTQNIDEGFLDIFILILIGIFIIFILDCFVRLSKRFT
jgi:hypothetical protein